MTQPAAPRPGTPAAPARPAPFAVFPLRFTARPGEMIDFLCTLGMAPLITTEGNGFADLVAGGGGRVMIHGAASSATGAPAGETQLSTAVRSADAAAERLREEGLEVVVWDESYGRQGNITGPHGEAIGLNEDQSDPYGYVEHDGGGADPRLTVVVVRPSAAGGERERDVALFSALGFRPEGPGDESCTRLTSTGGGTIGLHQPEEGWRPARPGDVGGADLQVSLVRLGFETTEDLAALAERLRAAGHPAELVASGSVHVTDPDGQHLEIHPAPASRR